jgi:hypothetical protein
LGIPAVGLNWPRSQRHLSWWPAVAPSSTAARSPATSRRSRWSARSAARTYDLDLRGAPATMRLRGRPGWVRFKPPPDQQVEPDEAAMVEPKEAVIANRPGTDLPAGPGRADPFRPAHHRALCQ